jgi:hypothetical protein
VVPRASGPVSNILRARNHFRRYRGRRVPYSFSAVPSVSGLVFMFCAPGLVFVGTKGIGSRFHALRAGTRFRRYRGSRVPFSCFAFPDSFSLMARASGLVFKFCAPILVFGGTEGVRSRFHILCARTRFRWYRRRRVPFSCFVLPD